jgi:hypothetical protein
MEELQHVDPVDQARGAEVFAQPVSGFMDATDSQEISGRSVDSRAPLTGLRLVAFLFGILVIGGLLVFAFGAIRDAVRFTDYTLYFSNLQGTRLVPVTRQVRRPDNDAARLAEVLQELIYGPVANDTLSSVPRGTKVLGSWISGDTAFVNFDRTLVLELPENADAEVLAVYAIVSAVVRNLSGINRVQLLVDDVPLQTLRGFSRVSGPLTPRPELVSVR